MNQEAFYSDGSLYDIINAGFVADRDFFLERAVAFGGPVLEVACGTGRITIPIAQHGIEVYGVDISGDMLSEARKKAEQAGLNIEWIEADCRSFSIPKRFSFIFIAFNSMLHLHDRVSLEQFLSRVRVHLLPGGRFMLDIFNPGVQFLSQNAGHRREVMKLTDPYSGKPAVIEETVDYDAATQVNRSTWFYSVGDKQDVLVHNLHLRCYFPQELDPLLEYNGFEVVEKLGDYDGAPFSSKSMRQIAKCQIQRS